MHSWYEYASRISTQKHFSVLVIVSVLLYGIRAFYCGSTGCPPPALAFCRYSSTSTVVLAHTAIVRRTTGVRTGTYSTILNVVHTAYLTAALLVDFRCTSRKVRYEIKEFGTLYTCNFL